MELPHFTCTNCRCWNGTAKGRTECRACGAPAPTVETSGVVELRAALRVALVQYDAMAETLTRTQDRCTGLLDVSRAAKRLVDANPSHGSAFVKLSALADLRGEVAKLRDIETALGVT